MMKEPGKENKNDERGEYVQKAITDNYIWNSGV